MSKNRVEKRRWLLGIFVLTGVILGMASGLGACKPKPTEVTLPFETIEQKEWAGTDKPYESREPTLIIVSRLEEVDNLNGLISDEAMIKLQALDYDEYFALVAFQGWKPSTGYSIQVNRISRLGNTVNIYTQLHEPTPDEAKADEVTSPYHLVQVQKSGSWGQVITFNLIGGETSIVSLFHTIP